MCESQTRRNLPERYGDNSFWLVTDDGPQLVEAGVNMVQVNMGNFEAGTCTQQLPAAEGFSVPAHGPSGRRPAGRPAGKRLAGRHVGRDGGRVRSNVMGSYNVAPNVWQAAWAATTGFVSVRPVCRRRRHRRPGHRLLRPRRAYPTSDPQTPRTSLRRSTALGIPRTAVWEDVGGQPHHVYQADPISRLFSQGMLCIVDAG